MVILLMLCSAGKFPFDSLLSYYKFEDLKQALEIETNLAYKSICQYIRSISLLCSFMKEGRKYPHVDKKLKKILH